MINAKRGGWGEDGGVIYVDGARWPAHGRLWSHLVSDVSFAELHAFAELLGAPRRGFDRDHYDIPADSVTPALWLGARLVSTKEIAPPPPEIGPPPPQTPVLTLAEPSLRML